MVEELKYAQIQVFGVEDEPVVLDDEPDDEEGDEDEEDEEKDEDKEDEEESGWQN